MTAPRTLYDKIWDDHVVETQPDGASLLYIDRHLVHEVTSPQAFEGLRMTGRTVRAPQKTLAVVDHNVPTSDRSQGIADPESRLQVETLAVALKVPVRKLEALEADQFDKLPDAVFVRALAASICRNLRVDPAPILERLSGRTTPSSTSSSLTGNWLRCRRRRRYWGG